MGRSVHDYDDAVHFVEAIPFERADRIFEQFDTAYAERFGEHSTPSSRLQRLRRRVLRVASDRVQRPAPGHGELIKSAGTWAAGTTSSRSARPASRVMASSQRFPVSG